MQPRGTQVWRGEELSKILFVEDHLRGAARRWGYQEIRLPNIWGAETFLKQDKLQHTMYTFKDKGDRDLCLVPEATAMIVELYKEKWEKTEKKPLKLFYLQRCYRYDKPQAGRYREFTQFGVEVLGGPNPMGEAYSFAVDIFFGRSQYTKFTRDPERGLHYYTGKTFEVECDLLGAQKQVLGGGEYAEGAGFGIGVERLAMADDAWQKTKFQKA